MELSVSTGSQIYEGGNTSKVIETVRLLSVHQNLTISFQVASSEIAQTRLTVAEAC